MMSLRTNEHDKEAAIVIDNNEVEAEVHPTEESNLPKGHFGLSVAVKVRLVGFALVALVAASKLGASFSSDKLKKVDRLFRGDELATENRDKARNLNNVCNSSGSTLTCEVNDFQQFSQNVGLQIMDKCNDGGWNVYISRPDIDEYVNKQICSSDSSFYTHYFYQDFLDVDDDNDAQYLIMMYQNGEDLRLYRTTGGTAVWGEYLLLNLGESCSQDGDCGVGLCTNICKNCDAQDEGGCICPKTCN